jgi:hypothetical protein
MKARDIRQTNKLGPNFVADKIEKPTIIINEGKESNKENKKERIPLDDNPLIHNINLKLYGFVFNKLGILKSGIIFGGTGILSIAYLYQMFYLKWFNQTYVNVAFIILLIYSINYFQFFFNKSCPHCKTKFSLIRGKTYKVGECKIEGEGYDLTETEYRCDKCGKTVVEEGKNKHPSSD